MRKYLAIGLAAALTLSGCQAAKSTASETTVPETTVTGTTAPETAVKEEEYQADVVVVGAGGAGMAAAIEAADAGASVVILEKMNYAGGNTARSEGGMNAAATSFQKEKGIEDTVEAMIEDTMKGGKEINNQELVSFFAEHSSETIDWLTSMGMDVSDVAQGAGAAYPRMHRPADGSKIGGVLVPNLMENLDERKVRILYSTEAVELLEESGEVTGVTAIDKDGNSLRFKANAIVMATGGFGANEELFVKYRPDLKGFTTTNHPGATGGGILMAEAVGADTVDMDQIQTNPTVEISSNTVISESVRGKGAIFVNQSGQRFTSEMQTRDVLSKAILEQPEQYAYMILDQRVMDSMAALKENYEKGIIIKGVDAAELAGKIDMDAEVLRKTLDDWNGAVAAKKDGAFGRDTGMDEDLATAPYYAIKVAPAVHYTMGGIVIDTDTQVINTEGNVIPGLYAAGEVTGGLHGANRLGGNAVADIMIFGRQAGINASKYALEKGSLEAVLPETGHASAPAVKGDFKDGIYEGSATGQNGEVKVQVTVSEGSITEIQVTENQETESIFAAVLRDLIPEIILTQSTEVDTISGATVSSKAVSQAVDAALQQAK